MMLRLAWRPVACGLLAAMPAFAQVEELPALTVSEAPPPPEQSQRDAADLDAAPTPALTEILRLTPGVHVDRAGAAGAVSSLYLRGAEPNYTAVFIDGVKLNDPVNTRGGSLDFSTATVDDFDGIEILRGPVSALYGADALAGAINLASARGRAPASLKASLAGADRGGGRAAATFGGAGGSVDYALGGGWTDAGRATPGSTARIGTAAGNLGWMPTPDRELRATLRWLDAELESFPDDSGGERHAVRRELERRGVRHWLGSTAARWDGPGGLAWRLRGGAYRRDEVVDSPGVAPGVRDLFGIPASTSDSTLDRAQLQGSVQASLGATDLLFGAEGEREEGRTDTRYELLGPANFALERDSSALFAQAARAFGPVLLEGGLRLDRPDGYGDVATPRLRAAWRIGDTTLSAAAGRGFKLPSFFALGNPVVGNPDLWPERSRGAELGVAQALGPARLSLALFRARYDDAIDFEEGPPPRLVNRDRVRTAGAEGAVAWAFGRGALEAQVSYVDARIDNSAERLRNRPRWTGGLEARYEPLDAVGLALRAVHVGRTLDSSIPTGDRELPSWTRLDGGVRWRVAAPVALRLDAENLLDADYDELLGFPGARRTARLRADLRF